MDQAAITEDLIGEIMSYRRIVPDGWRIAFIEIAWMKAVVEQCEMEDRERLQFLETIDSFATASPGFEQPLDRAVLTAIPPLDDTSMQIVAEVHKLDPPDKCHELLASDEVFATLLRLNPGLAAAIVAHGEAPVRRYSAR
jgi:hypothetical protein